MYDHKKIEKEMAEFWKSNKIYEKMQISNTGNPESLCNL
jgi:isoleucyl-tRNA synthetase